jgi:hypothetical protein
VLCLVRIVRLCLEHGIEPAGVECWRPIGPLSPLSASKRALE